MKLYMDMYSVFTMYQDQLQQAHIPQFQPQNPSWIYVRDELEIFCYGFSHLVHGHLQTQCFQTNIAKHPSESCYARQCQQRSLLVSLQYVGAVQTRAACRAEDGKTLHPHMSSAGGPIVSTHQMLHTPTNQFKTCTYCLNCNKELTYHQLLP